MSKETVVITGGAGYIGAHFCKFLSKFNYEIAVVDDFSTGNKNACKWGKCYEINISDSADLTDLLKKIKPSAVFHFAAFTNVGESVHSPNKYYSNNVVGTLSLLEAMREANCKKLVFSSSCAVYGIPEAIPITENEKKQPINVYGFSKFVMEQAIEDYSRAYGLKGVCLRYFNACGADPDGEIGERHSPETHLIPIIFAAIRDAKPITVFGNDYDTPDGTCIRDYIHVNDLAEAHYLALKYLDKGGTTTGINLGTGKGHSVLEIIKVVEKVTGSKVPFQLGARRIGDPPELVAFPERAKKVLGWQAKYLDIEKTVQHAWHWFQNCPW